MKYVVLPNQVRLPFLEQGDQQGVVVIFLHGLADSCHTFELLFHFLPRSIHAIAFDQRGHGDASRPAFGYQTSDFVTDLLMFMDSLQIERAILVGASSGGFVARRFALEYPKRTQALVLLGAPAGFADNLPVLATWESTISKLTDPINPEFVRDFTRGLISRPVPQEFVEESIKDSLKVPAHVWIETFAGMLAEQFPDDLAQIDAPTLVIWGEQDPILTRSEQEAIARTIPGSSLVVVADSGHMLYWEQPQSVASHLIGFIDAIAENG